MTKRILVALSGTPFTPSAVAHAIEIAGRSGGVVTGATCVDVAAIESVGPVPIGAGASAHALAEHRLRVTRERVDEQVAAFEDACGAAGVEHSVVRETGDPLEAFTRLSRFHDLAVMGLRGLFDYGVIDSPTTRVCKLLHAGVRPILAVAEEQHRVQRVLVAYNGSMGSATALKTYVQYGLWADAEMRILTFAGHDEDEGESSIELAADYCRTHGRAVETVVHEGRATTGLLAEATTWNADLIVMGSTHRSRLAQMVLGDTALAAMRGAEVPLFLSQ